MKTRTVRLPTPEEEAKLFDALTSRRCETLADVAAALGELRRWKAKDLIYRQRYAAASGNSWWTVPHAPRGGGPKAFLVIEARSNNQLTSEDREVVTRGRISTIAESIAELQTVAITCEYLGKNTYLPLPLRAQCLAQGFILQQVVTHLQGVVEQLKTS
jgi:hypothetical protein